MRIPERVKIVEVGPRDGLQNEATPVAPAVRAELIRRLAGAGLPVVEAGSFVSPKWVPQMADTAQVLAALDRPTGTRFPVLTPNLTGFRQAVAAGAREVAVFVAASETFSRQNINCSVDDSLQRCAEVCEAAKLLGIAVRGYVSCVLGCPYEGGVAPAKVVAVAGRLLGLGCYEISLGDTIGVGTAGEAERLVDQVAATVPVERLAAHFHDTYGQALANVLAVLGRGVAVVDSAVAGLGGCPYAPGAAGNLATEDLVYMLHGFGVATGADLGHVAAAGRFICNELRRSPDSKTARALAARVPA
ncbi:MAG: hydroxymethylglutaryl-CoA lyase [Rhodospirillales bacterium]|nr:MAG: hydroxymethylglutaryl-CoA lyase [Rhodospirillales bacterium]